MSRRFWKWIGSFGLVLTSAAGIAYAATPGYHRAATPGLFGMNQVAPNLFIDDRSHADLVQKLILEAEATTQAFFGTLRANPTFVVCTNQACKDNFGLKPRGLSLGYHFILIDHIDESA